MNLSPAQRAATIRAVTDGGASPGPASSGLSFFTVAILAGVAYGGYRVYKHFRKG